MKNYMKPHTRVAVLRPWPFGPPLRGRAPHRDAGMPGVHHAPRTAIPASTPVGGSASSPKQCFAL